MITAHEGRGVGRFSVTVELTNNQDLAYAARGVIPHEQVRRVTIRGVVDTGATRLVIPQSVADALGVPINGQATVRYGDGRTGLRSMATDIHLSYGGRASVFNAVVEPGRDSALIGAIVLEDLDLVADCTAQLLVPRDPRYIISEIE